MTDGRTVGWSDGRTESIIAKTALCIASYADALSKTIESSRLKAEEPSDHLADNHVAIFCFQN